MKIYTEVNYEWLNDKLVQTSSKSFDYEGELTLLGGDSGGGGTLGSIGRSASKAATSGVKKISAAAKNDPFAKMFKTPAGAKILADMNKKIMSSL